MKNMWIRLMKVIIGIIATKRGTIILTTFILSVIIKQKTN